MNIRSTVFTAFLTVLCGWPSYLVAQAEEANRNDGYWVDLVNHDDHSIVINDVRYSMPITLKTYIADTKTGKDRKVNRYALKKGQLVLFRKTIRNNQAYIESITIYQP